MSYYLVILFFFSASPQFPDGIASKVHAKPFSTLEECEAYGKQEVQTTERQRASVTFGCIGVK
jgi:hypothetical protein